MASNGIRHVGPPSICEFVDLHSPEPPHNEVNAWQHMLSLVYKEELNLNCIESLLDTLRSTAKLHSQQTVGSQLTATIPHPESAGERVGQMVIFYE